VKAILIYIARRVGTSVAMIFVLSFALFVIIQSKVPGNEASILGGSNATAAQVRAIESRLGLSKPILLQYFTWLGHALTGNLGTSLVSGQKVISVVARQAPVSLELAFLSLTIATIVGIPIGLAAGILNGSKWDVILRIPFLVLYSLPLAVSGVLLLLGASKYLPSLYASTYVSFTSDPMGNLRGMFLPALAVGLPVSGLLVQMTRATVAEVLSQPYIATARAVGLPRWRQYGIYTLKAASLPILSLEGFLFGILIGAVVVAEQVFSLPGLGRGLLDSINNRDFIELEAQILIIAATFVVGNLLADLAAPFVDKRIASD
jgi:peptide/nickel transport system permease protein